MPEPAVTIELATPSDGPAVAALIGRVFAEYGFLWDPETEVPDVLDLGRRYQPPRGAFFVARLAGQVVGSVAVDREGDGSAELHRLYVGATHRGRGLGRALVETVLEWCRARSIGHLVLWSDTRFLDAHRLYGRLGFARTGERTLPGDPNQTREFRYERPIGAAITPEAASTPSP